MLRFLREFIASRGFPPTVRELCEAFGFRSTKAGTDYLHALETKGAIACQHGKARAIRVLEGAA